MFHAIDTFVSFAYDQVCCFDLLWCR